MAVARSSKPVVVVEEPPQLEAIVRFYPTSIEVLRAYVESDFHAQLAVEHERRVSALAGEKAEVTDAASITRVGELLVDVVRHKRDVETWFKPLKDFAYRMHRMVCDRESSILKPLEAFESTAKSNVDMYRREQERRRREEEERLAEEARQVEQRRLEAEAATLEQNGEHDLAQQVFEQAIATPAPVIVVASTVPMVKGMSFRENWKWRPIGGDTAQARARAAQLVPREYLCLDEKKLNAYAKAHGASGRIPGIQFYDAGTVSVRS